MGKQKISKHAISMLEYLHKDQKYTVKDIIKQDLTCLRGLSQSTIYKHATGMFGKGRRTTSTRGAGRPALVTPADMRAIKRAIPKLRADVGLKFTVASVQREASLLHVELSTVRKAMYKLGLRSRVARKKGVLSECDKKLRLAWAREHKSKSKVDWRRDVSAWTDIVGFEYKVINLH